MSAIQVSVLAVTAVLITDNSEHVNIHYMEKSLWAPDHPTYILYLPTKIKA